MLAALRSTRPWGVVERGRAWVWAIVAAAMLATPAAAQPVDPDDEAAIRAGLGLYLTRADRRDEAEQIRRTGDRMELWFLEPLVDAREDRVCDGLRWLLAGRLANATGARGVFAARPGLNELTLVFYRVDTQVEPDREGRYRQTRAATPTARLTVTRDQSGRLDPKILRRTLNGPRCVPVGKQLLSQFWVRRQGE